MKIWNDLRRRLGVAAGALIALGLPAAAAGPSEPDATAADREQSAGRIVQAAAQCDAQVKGLQELLSLERKQDAQKPQPEVGAHVGPLPD